MSGGSNKPILLELCWQVFLVCRAKGIVLKVEWRNQEEAEMVEAHLGSRGPWAPLEEFQLDFEYMLQILSLWNFSWDGM